MVNLLVSGYFSIFFRSLIEAFNVSSSLPFTLNNLINPQSKSKKRLHGMEMNKALLSNDSREISFDHCNSNPSISRHFSNSKARKKSKIYKGKSIISIKKVSMITPINDSNKRKRHEIFNSTFNEIYKLTENIEFFPIKPLIDYSSFQSISQSIIQWIINMEGITNNDNQFEKIIDSIKPIIEIIKMKIFSLDSSKDNIKDENGSTIKLLTLFEQLNNSNNNSLIPIIREFCHFHSNNESFKLILNNNSCNYDPLRVQVISTLIAPFNHKRVAIEMSKIIGEYDQSDKSLKCFYSKVINNLELSENEKSKLDFYSSTFIRNLIPLIENVSIPRYNLFWYNLNRLAFKWIIYQKEQIINENHENNFKEVLKDIKSISFIILNKGGITTPINFNLESIKTNIFIEPGSLFKYEFLENDHLFPSLADSIKDFYDQINDNVSKNEDFACELLKLKYFNGHFDSNIRLKYLIFLYSPIKEMRFCILKEDSQSDPYPWYFSNLSNKRVTKEYLKDLRIKGPKNLEVNLLYDEDYLSGSALEFLQSRGQRIKIWSKFSIFYFLRVLNREDLLTWKMVMDLAGFALDNKTLEWNQEKFDEKINYFKKNSFDYKYECCELESYLEKLGPRS